MMRTLDLLLIVSLFQIGAIAGDKEINSTPLLVIEGLGNGYSSPAVTSDRIFVTGEKEGIGSLFSFDFTGKLLWKKEYGREWTLSFRGSRAAPVVADTLIYTSSGMGDIACFDARTGQQQWLVSMISDLHGINAVYGYSMPVLIAKDRLYCFPGGADTNVACLNRHTGKIIWTSPGNGEAPGYADPILIRNHDRDLLIMFSEMAMLGMDAGSGELLWTWELSFKGNVPCNKPVYDEGYLYIAEGMGNGAAKFKISDDGSQLRKIWDNPEFDPYFGGFVKIGDLLYGSSESRRLYWSISAETGKVSDSLPFRTGAAIASGNDLILYNQRGKVGIVQLNQGKMFLAASFDITKGTNEHFSHPVVVSGKLYIRHGNALLVYDYEELNNDRDHGQSH